ncbi:MAG: hypothetical protein IJL48_03380 [Bacteroidales bacterium]|nr:hypothetical protein [Bacteroidales bacterium]
MKRNILLLILLGAQTLVAQTPCGTTTDGKPLPRPSASTIDSLVKAKAYADAYDLLQQEYTCAKAEGRSYDLLRAACGMASVGKQLPVNNDAEALLRHTLPHLAPPEKALCHSLLAGTYAQVLRNRNQNRFNNQDLPCPNNIDDTVYSQWCNEKLSTLILFHSQAALSTPATLLQSIKMKDYDFLATHDTLNDYSALTLYEAVSYDAIHNIVGSDLLFNGSTLVYSDSLYHALCNPFVLAAIPKPQGNATLTKLAILQEVATYLIHNGTDTSYTQWHTLRRELRSFIDHYANAYRQSNPIKFRLQPSARLDVGPIVAPGSGCFFTYTGDTDTTLYLRILPSISKAFDTLPSNKKLRYALSQPALHSLTVNVHKPTAGSQHKLRYHFPSLPAGDYSMIVSEMPYPTALDIPDSCLPAVYHYTFSCQTAAIEPISQSHGQGLVMNIETGQPIPDIPVTMKGKYYYTKNPDSDSLSLTTLTDTLGRFNFSPLMPVGEYTYPVYSITHQGHPITVKLGAQTYNIVSRGQIDPDGEDDDSDTLVSFFLNAPVYRYSDTVRFTAMVQRSTPKTNQPVPNHRVRITLSTNYYSDSITSLQLTTDNMGWAEGIFILPQVLNANKNYDNRLYLIAYDHDGNNMGTASFSVDNYTLPTLSLSLNTTADTHLYGQPVTIQGRLTSRNGSAVAPSSVTYTLTQSFGFAPWMKNVGSEHDGGSFVVSTGELPTQPDNQGAQAGDFTFQFTPVKYDFLPYLDGEYAEYLFTVTATDPTGETVKESISIAVGDYTGSFSINQYSSSTNNITDDYNSRYIGSLDDIYVSCQSLDNSPLSSTALLTIEKVTASGTPIPSNPSRVWQGEISIPATTSFVPLSTLVPPIHLPDGHLRLILSSANPHLHPDTLQVSHLGFNAPMPLDSLTLFASTEKTQYHPGDTLRLRVGSAGKISAMLLINCGENIVMLRHLRLDHGFTHIALPIQKQWSDRICISILAYHQGQRFSGSADVDILQPAPQLKLQWLEPEALNLTPADSGFCLHKLYAGAPFHWRLRVTDSLGNPVQSIMALTAFDEAINHLEHVGQHSFHPQQAYRYHYSPRYSFMGSEYSDNRSRLTIVHQTKEKQQPFYRLSLSNSYRYRTPMVNYLDQRWVMALLSVGTHGYDVLHCVSASIIPDMSWGKVDNLSQPQGIIRNNLSPYGPWFGRLHSDRNGIVDIRFNAPQRLARWWLSLVAMSGDGTFVNRANLFDTYRDIMLMPNVPPFLYTGDSTALALRVDRMDGATTNGLAVRMYNGAKLKGKPEAETLLAGATTAQFPIQAPRTLLPLAPKSRTFTFAIGDPLHNDIVLDAQTSTLCLLRHPRLHANAYPSVAKDYRTLTSRFRGMFYPYDRAKPDVINNLFDSLYYAVVFNRPNADSLVQVLTDAQLPSGGWPCIRGQKSLFNESDAIHNLNIIMQLQQHCPHFTIPAAFNIKRAVETTDSLMFQYWKHFPKTTNNAAQWITLRRHFAQYPLDTAYYAMRDSLHANILKNKPDQWVIPYLYRSGDTALALQMAKNIVQSSVYDSAHPEQGRRWKHFDHNSMLINLYIDIFEEVLHDTALADQVRQRIRYLAPTTHWDDMHRARLVARHLLPAEQPALSSLGDFGQTLQQKSEPLITLSREIINTSAKADTASTIGELTIKLTLTLSRPMDRLYLRAPMAACFASHSEVTVVATTAENRNWIEVKSLDANLGSVAASPSEPVNCLDIYIEELPAGTHTLMYTVVTDRHGRFHLPAATVQCLAVSPADLGNPLLRAATTEMSITM